MKISGLVCKNFTDNYSRPDAKESIQDYFESENMVAISDVDTRALVGYIRDKGAMNGIISSDNTDISRLKQQLDLVPSMNGLQLCDQVSTKEPYFFGDESADYKVAVLDFGVKEYLKMPSSKRLLYESFPFDTSFEELQVWQPDGYFLSNGPGDPSAMPNVIETVKKITQTMFPVFGICLGHQAAISEGIGTYKMHNGHRGINHPVQHLMTGNVSNLKIMVLE